MHSGSCHCGAVAFEFDASSTTAFTCNCSICHRRGAIWQGCDAAHFHLLRGQQALRTYTFGTHTAQHFFCRHCGVAPFSHPRLSPRHWVINLRCVEDVDLSTWAIHNFDGQHWEQAAREWSHAQGNRPTKP